MRTLEAQGKSIDEAIFNGLKELGVSIDEVEIDIIQQESKGVLGIGAKPAKVRLIEREPEQIIIPDYLTEADRMHTGERSGPRSDRNRPRQGRDNRDRAPRNDRPRQENERREDDGQSQSVAPRRDNRDRQDRRPRQAREEYIETPKKPEIEYTAEAAENNPAAEFLKGLLSIMGIEASILANVTEEGIRLRIDSESMGILIGHRGETLDAIQYLTSLNVNRSRKENGYTRVTIDTEGYRDKREETLVRLARKVASQVRSTGRPRALEPMNPYERRVLHSALQNSQYVTTYSEGEEPNRRVVIALKEGVKPQRNNNRPRGDRPARESRPNQENVTQVEMNETQPDENGEN